MDDQAIKIDVGNTVRVLVPGKFQNQIVKVLRTKVRKHTIAYQLDTKWDDKPFPGWFVHTEIEKVNEKERMSQ